MQDGKESGCLISLPLHTFVQKVGARSAAPGGGSVAAAMSSLVHEPLVFIMLYRLLVHLSHKSDRAGFQVQMGDLNLVKSRV